MFVSATAESPIALPAGVQIRSSDRLAAVLGRGTPTGRANAITLGDVIVVPTRFAFLSQPEREEVIRHELVHVQQRERYGRFYLIVYGVLYLMHGYSDHPFEREAGARPGPVTGYGLWRKHPIEPPRSGTHIGGEIARMSPPVS
jgi:hypothetical protein